MKELEYVDVIDIDGTKRLREDIGLYYEENGINYTIRVDFKENFKTLDQYMKTAYEIISFDQFSEEEIRLMKESYYEGFFVYKLVLDDNTVVSHYYTFIGMEEKDEVRVVPVRIPKENKHTIDPTRVQSTSWYYIKDNNSVEYAQLV